MKIYNLNCEKVRPEEVREGNEYLLLENMFTVEEFYDKKFYYFFETVIPQKEIYLISKPTGEKPFSSATNDCLTDKFDYGQTSKIILNPGQILMYSDKRYILLFKIKDLSDMKVTLTCVLSTTEENSGYTRLTQSSFAGKFVLDDLYKFIKHGKRVIELDEGTLDQAIPTWSFNPSRILSIHLFKMEDKKLKDLVTYDGDKKLLFNKNSKSRYHGVPPKSYESGVFKVFYSKRFQEQTIVYVDGFMMNLLKDYDVDEYKLTGYFRQNNPQLVRLRVYDDYYYGVRDSRGNYRIIFKEGDNFRSFILNSRELQFIDDVEYLYK